MTQHYKKKSNHNIITSTYTGFFLWRRIIKLYKLDLFQDFVIVLPKGEEQITYYMLLYLNKVIERFELSKNNLVRMHITVLRRNELFFVLTDDEQIYKYAKYLCRRVNVSLIETKKMQAIIDSYCMFPFSNRLILGMTKKLQARGGQNALKTIGITQEEIVANGIYDLRIEKFNKKTRPRLPKMRDCDDDFCNYVKRNDLRLLYD